MSSRAILRSPASAALLVELAVEHGMTEAAALAGTSLTRRRLDDPEVEVSTRDELTIVTSIVDTLGDDIGLGIEAGLRCHTTSPGIWGLALISCRTLREAVEVGVSLAGLSFLLCRIESTVEADGAQRLTLDASDIPVAIRRFVVERDLTGIRSLQRELLGMPDSALAVSFSCAGPVLPDTAYREVFGAAPTFGAGENSVVFPRELLDRPLPWANDHTRRMAENQAIELLRQRSARSGVAGLIRELLLADPAHAPTLDEAARRLTVSSRTLRRRLAEEGVSLRVLQEEVREALAEEMLITEHLAVAEIADRLGYSEVSSFTQAFRRWKGVGPREYRNRAAGR